ncbi:DUF4083 domain-containing protein [Virgibacillus salexigens]|uniref:DUF4083 domain-containing protein n=1 Tax=Virgibacillus TaxID=84406 RepID=UPI0018E11266|nr:MULTISPECIES: DUF4083 domain-containing protein [Virgibacillus]
MGGFHFGDVLFQLLSLAFIILIIVLTVSLFRSNKKRTNQLNRIEKKIDDENHRIKNGNE